MHLNRVPQEVNEYVKVLGLRAFVIAKMRHRAKCHDVYVLQQIESEWLQIKLKEKFPETHVLPNST